MGKPVKSTFFISVVQGEATWIRDGELQFCICVRTSARIHCIKFASHSMTILTLCSSIFCFTADTPKNGSSTKKPFQILSCEKWKKKIISRRNAKMWNLTQEQIKICIASHEHFDFYRLVPFYFGSHLHCITMPASMSFYEERIRSWRRGQMIS